MWCNNCIYLDKTRRQESKNGTNCFRYGCNTRIDGHICGWITQDKELKTMGCSDSNKVRVGTEFIVANRYKKQIKTFLYCGKINGRPLLYCLEEQKYRIVSTNYLRTQAGKLKDNIRVVAKSEEQFKRNKRKAKQKRRRYIEDVEENMPFI